MDIILASKSPRRQELLTRLGIDYLVRLADHDETMNPFADPADEVARVSLLKARAVCPLCHDEDIIVAADTIVVCDGLVMGKPHSEKEAAAMLRRLSGREHQVMTGLTVMQGSQVQTVTEQTAIRFRALSEEEIAAYVATGEPMDKAGSYGIQGIAAMFVTGIEGDYYNVMGLPLCALTTLLRQRGVKILGI